MIDTGSLELLAEVSIALAGFSGVVLILGRRSSGHLSALERRRLGFLLETTLGVFFLSLTPLVISAAGVPPQLNLRICSAAMLGLAVSLGVLWFIRNARLSDEESARRVRPLEAIVWALFVPESVCLLVVAFGAWGRFAMAIYLAGLTAFLLGAAFQFYLLLGAVGESNDAAV
jgi:hypothetical protein